MQRDGQEDEQGFLVQAQPSQSQAENELYPPLPIGSNAFQSPLNSVPVSPAPAKFDYRAKISQLPARLAKFSKLTARLNLPKPSKKAAAIAAACCAAVLASAIALSGTESAEPIASTYPTEQDRVGIEPEPVEPTELPRPSAALGAIAPDALRAAEEAERRVRQEHQEMLAAQAEQPTGADALGEDSDVEAQPAEDQNQPQSKAIRKKHRSKRVNKARRRARRRNAGSKSARQTVPILPTRATVLAAMKRVTPTVRSCLKPSDGVAKVKIKFLGKTGRVASTSVSGVQGVPAACVKNAVRRAKVPPFRDKDLDISFPFNAR